MADQSSFGLYIPTTQVWDQGTIPGADPEDSNEMVVRLHQNINSIATALNLKDSGYYNTGMPFISGQQFFPNPALNSTTADVADYRPTFRLVIDFGSYLGVTKTVPHGITIDNAVTFTRIYGTANNTNTLVYNPLPNPTNNITVTNTNVIITGAGVYNVVYVILEYMTS